MLRKHMERRGHSKESELTGGTKNDQKEKDSNDKKQSQRLEFVTINRRKKDLVYINLEAVRKCIYLYIYLWVLLFCNLKTEQTKHLATISSAMLVRCAFTIPPL